MRNKNIFCVILMLALFLAGSFANFAFGGPAETQKEVTELERVVKMLAEGIQSRENRLNELTAQLKVSEKELQKAETELAKATAKLKEKNQVFGERVRTAYMKGGLSYLEVLLDADSFGDLISRLVYMTRILGRDASIVSALRDEYKSLHERRIALQEEQAKLEDFRYQIESEHKNLVAEKKQMDVLLAATKNKLADDLAKIAPQAEKKPVYGVIIDNLSAARPQYGLSAANVIYEYEVEGRITRLLALFANLPTKVGPLRSARLHSMLLALENNVNYVHAGGSFDNIELKALLKLDSTDALLSDSSQFFRDPSRKAPHNLFVNLQQLKVTAPSNAVVVRPAFLSREGQPGSSLSLTISNTYRVSYEYIASKGYYHRFINGKQHFDGNGTAIAARNIIVQYTPYYNDKFGRATADLIGEGSIDFYAQGKKFRGIWRKSSESSPTRFFYEDGQEIERIYGQTWIQIVRS